MADKKIIIDGVDVSKCFYYINNKEYTCRLNHTPFHYRHCEDNPNCYFKQLQRKTIECERLKYDNGYEIGVLEKTIDNLKAENEELKEYIQEREVWGDHCEFCKHNDKENCHQNIILDNLKTINCYCKALEEIENIVSGDYETLDPLAKKQIFNIINKAKENNNE